jgi:uncharacterized protein YbaR (Trm112 family)
MKRRLLKYLVCPVCQVTPELTVASEADNQTEIREGSLRCPECRRTYPIRRGIPRLVPSELSKDKERTAARFGWEWNHFAEMHQEHRDQFLDWIAPLQPSFFKDKVILDAGCGMGRHAYYAAEFGARDVIAMDLSQAVETAYRNIGHLPNVHVVQGDILVPPLRRAPARPELDFAYCIGVLHHLPDPKAGFESLVQLLKPSGTVFAWVYGHENNGIVHNVIDPIRKRLASRMSPRALLALSWPITAVLQGLAGGIYHPARRTRLFKYLPSHAYIDSLTSFSFRHKYAIVFDHLTAPTAFYIPGPEFESWFSELGLEEVEISWRNENSWRGRGRQPQVLATAEAAQ